MDKESFRYTGLSDGRRGVAAEGAFLTVVFGIVAVIFELAGITQLRWLWVGVIFGIFIMVGAYFASDVARKEREKIAKSVKEKVDEEIKGL